MVVNALQDAVILLGSNTNNVKLNV